MGSNPSSFSGGRIPVENISWLDAVSFCNAYSEEKGLEPVYSIDGQNASWNRARTDTACRMMWQSGLRKTG